MRNRVFSLWIVAALVVLGACAPTVAGNPVDPTATELSPTAGAGTTAVPTATGLSATLEAPSRLPDGNRVMIQFILTNNSDAELYVLKWYTPLEGIGGEIFRVERDGQVVPYAGILAMRGDPTPEGYILLAAGQSTSAEVDLATSFDFSQPGEYTIEFLSPRISHVARSEAEMARSVDDLGPVAIPSNTITVKVEGSSIEPTAGDQLVHYQGVSPYYPDSPPFEIDYLPSVWELVQADGPGDVDQLQHRHMAGCSLRLGEGPVGALPVPTVSLAGRDWAVFQVQPRLLHYCTQQDYNSFLFGLTMPDPYKGSAKDPCQQAAEVVLKTFSVALPHSMKGYELYSWYEESEDQWSYTLVAGSNRLKTIEEFHAREYYVHPGGWVSITVRDDEALKTVLRRLLEGEQVTWIGAEWLKQVGADREMVGTMRLPDPATVAEIEAFCRELGVNMHVAAAPDPTSQAEPTPPPSRTVLPKETSQETETSLVIREVPIVAAVVDGPGHLEYDDRLGDEILDRIKALRDWSAERAMAQTNAALAPFGYRLDSRVRLNGTGETYNLYREGEEKPRLTDLSPIWPFLLSASVNASGTDLVLVTEHIPITNPWKLLKNSDEVQSLARETGQLPLSPAYVGDALAYVTATGFPTITYQVEMDGQGVYTGTAAAYGAYYPLQSFTTWNGHWALEADDHLIIDGEDVGQTLGYDAVFGFTRLEDRSFFFFEWDGLVYITYDGQVLPHTYDMVFHNRCCEAAIHNVEAGPDAVWFHALREGVWCWVEAGLANESE
jgi:hypothetical protein